jgi:hypothetical protein
MLRSEIVSSKIAVMQTVCTSSQSLESAIRQSGYAFVHGDTMRDILAPHGSLADWERFADTWNDLAVDTYMADGGRYRRRRHATYTATPAAIERRPHQPHFQALDYNPLNGGVARWFEPVSLAAGAGASMRTILAFCRSFFGAQAPTTITWQVEVHQFRIEARSEEEGRPTPEGLHRDGVDYVLVLLIHRHNIASGTTTIHARDGGQLGTFTLTDPLDAALVDDSRVYHGVTPVQAIEPSRPAYRDVLVVTFAGSQLREQGSGIRVQGAT